MTTETKTLADRAMLVGLSISRWGMRTQDKAATELVQVSKRASADSGKFQKNLLNRKDETVKKINSIADMTRMFHYANTLPWLDDGRRILPSANYMRYTDSMRTFKAAFEEAVKDFVDSYPALVEHAKTMLGDLFNEADYPQPHEVHEAYGIKVSVDPLPDVRDFRISISQEDLADAIKRYEDAQDKAMKDLWGRINEVIGKVHEKLSDPEGIFRDSLIDNVAELAEMLPRLNITDDPALKRMQKVINEKIATLDPQELRDDNKVRKEAARDAKSILDAMASYV